MPICTYTVHICCHWACFKPPHPQRVGAANGAWDDLFRRRWGATKARTKPRFLCGMKWFVNVWLMVGYGMNNMFSVYGDNARRQCCHKQCLSSYASKAAAQETKVRSRFHYAQALAQSDFNATKLFNRSSNDGITRSALVEKPSICRT